MGAHYDRARLLSMHLRHEQAERELREELAESPHWGQAHAFLGYCLAQQKRLPEALTAGEEGVRLSPELPYAHYMLALSYIDAGRPKDAEAAITEALRLDPRSPEMLSWLAWLQFQRGDRRGALATADEGLAIDPQHVTCLNRRGLFLNQLGNWQPSEVALRSALALAPEHAYTHANLGWTLWTKAHSLAGNPRPLRQPWAVFTRPELREAMDHFREALRLSPGWDWARTGLEEILLTRRKAVLRLFLSLVVIGAGLLLRLYMGPELSAGAGARPGPAPSFDDPVFWGLFLVLFGAVTIVLSNGPVYLLMRASRLGEAVLAPARRRAAKATAVCLLTAAAGTLLGLLTTSLTAPVPLFFGSLAFFSLALIGPLTVACEATAGWVRYFLTWYVLLLAAGGVACSAFLLGVEEEMPDAGAAILLLTVLVVTAGSLASRKFAGVLEKRFQKKAG